jgi:hypothetical protein
MAIIVMLHEANATRMPRVNVYTPYWSQRNCPRSTEKTGQALFRILMNQQTHLPAQNAIGKIVPFFLSKFPYLVVSFMF